MEASINRVKGMDDNDFKHDYVIEVERASRIKITVQSTDSMDAEIQVEEIIRQGLLPIDGWTVDRETIEDVVGPTG